MISIKEDTGIQNPTFYDRSDSGSSKINGFGSIVIKK
jgi:hypothetical protein